MFLLYQLSFENARFEMMRLFVNYSKFPYRISYEDRRKAKNMV